MRFLSGWIDRYTYQVAQLWIEHDLDATATKRWNGNLDLLGRTCEEIIEACEEPLDIVKLFVYSGIHNSAVRVVGRWEVYDIRNISTDCGYLLAVKILQ